MIKNSNRYSTGLGLLFACLLLIGCAQGMAREYESTSKDGQNCSLSVPPLDSGKNTVHGTFIYVFPRTLSTNYSGCQTMWDQSGRKWMVLLLKEGHPSLLSVSYPESPEKTIEYSCRYKDDNLLTTSEKQCEEFDKGKPFGNLAFQSEELKMTDPAYEILQRLRAGIQ
jgi:hypothetical protein